MDEQEFRQWTTQWLCSVNSWLPWMTSWIAFSLEPSLMRLNIHWRWQEAAKDEVFCLWSLKWSWNTQVEEWSANWCIMMKCKVWQISAAEGLLHIYSLVMTKFTQKRSTFSCKGLLSVLGEGVKVGSHTQTVIRWPFCEPLKCRRKSNYLRKSMRTCKLGIKLHLAVKWQC